MGIFKSYRSVRAEARSRSKTKNFKSKPQSVRASQRKSSSGSGYDTMSDSSSEDLTEQEEWPIIKRKPNEGLQAFMDRFKVESAHIKGVPSVHGQPELAKKLNDKIPKNMASGRLTYQVKDIRQSGKKNKGSAKGKGKVISMVWSLVRILAGIQDVPPQLRILLNGYNLFLVNE
ncbi:hypothetical protein Tco_0206710 [Tanacetum coccineum]